MQSSLESPVSLVTGASGGIGLEIAMALGLAGYRLTLVGRNADRLEGVRAELAMAGGEALAVQADLNAAGAAELLLRQHWERFGRLDVLVNSAGVARPSRAGRERDADVDDQVRTNLESLIRMYHAALDSLLATAADQGVSRVFNIASLTGLRPQPWLAVYSATKAAVVAYSDAMNQAYAKSGVLSTTVCPGWVQTAMSEGARGIEPDSMIPASDLAHLVVAMCALSARSYVPVLPVTRSASADSSGL